MIVRTVRIEIFFQNVTGKRILVFYYYQFLIKVPNDFLFKVAKRVIKCQVKLWNYKAFSSSLWKHLKNRPSWKYKTRWIQSAIGEWNLSNLNIIISLGGVSSTDISKACLLYVVIGYPLFFCYYCKTCSCLGMYFFLQTLFFGILFFIIDMFFQGILYIDEWCTSLDLLYKVLL